MTTSTSNKKHRKTISEVTVDSGLLLPSDISGPVTTTKALFVQIFAPRKFSTKLLLKEEEDPDSTVQEEEELSTAATTVISNNNNVPKTSTPLIGNDKQEEQEQQPKTSRWGKQEKEAITTTDVVTSAARTTDQTEKQAPPVLPAGATKQEKNETTIMAAAAPIRTSEASIDDDAKVVVDETGGDERTGLETVETQQQSQVEIDEEAGDAKEPLMIREDAAQDSMEVTPEEAAAVQIKSQNENVVNVEELLRICFHKLAEEWHLLNIPTYSIVKKLSKQQIIVEESETDEGSAIHYTISERQLPLYDDKDKDGDDGDDDTDDNSHLEWIQVMVMVRPPSLGIVLDRLERIGVGTNCGTLSVFQAELCRTASPYAMMPPVPEESNDEMEDDEEEEEDEDGKKDSNEAKKDAEKSTTLNGQKESDVSEPKDPLKRSTSNDVNTSSRAPASRPGSVVSENEAAKERAIEAAKAEWKNAATRLRLEQVREQIVEQSAFSFDFIALLTVASILAGVGLITDNTVVIVASMLVSPIMGPVLGLTFGTRIQDWPLVLSSFRHESLALLGCVLIGALVGIGAAFTKLAEDTWPTNEMQIRGEATGLLTGIAIAIPSGMGVCLSILGGNTSSLVGVAISASLLPPAVNTGVCLVYSLFLQLGVADSDVSNAAEEFAVIGGISFALTVINIACIWVSGLVMFEIKEVAPMQEKNAFWAKDIKVARQLNKAGGKNAKPPSINMGVLQQGVKSILNKRRQDSERPIEDVRLQPPRHRKRPFSLGNAFFLGNSTQKNLGLRTNGGRPRPGVPGVVWADLSTEPANGEQQQVDDDDNVRYVGLEDMAGLLGFDKESDFDEDSDIDYDLLAQNLGRGRYL